jgi:hypothetical protein
VFFSVADALVPSIAQAGRSTVGRNKHREVSESPMSGGPAIASRRTALIRNLQTAAAYKGRAGNVISDALLPAS